MESSRQIEDAAAEWIVRRGGEEWTAADESQLDDWLGASSAHRVAYLRLEAAWEQTLRLQALGAGTPSGVVPPAGHWQVSPFFEQRSPAPLRSPRKKWLGLAAAVLLLFGLGAYLAILFQGDRYATPVGGMASIPLADGSNVTLNTGSKIRVLLSSRRRLVELAAGEAFFDVARDASRPFVVEAAGKRIVAVGTQFSVRRDREDVRVIVSEGRVRIEAAGAAPVLDAGATARIANAKLLVQRESLREAEEALSWRTGYLTFNSLPLAAAVAEFNRYTSRRIVIHDPHVAALRVSGKFRATNAEAFIRVLHEGFGIEARETRDEIMLSGSSADSAP